MDFARLLGNQRTGNDLLMGTEIATVLMPAPWLAAYGVAVTYVAFSS